eukprot:scaffold19_cov114-Cylindrotheca_fusiformis.AAC.15
MIGEMVYRSIATNNSIRSQAYRSFQDDKKLVAVQPSRGLNKTLRGAISVPQRVTLLLFRRFQTVGQNYERNPAHNVFRPQ